MVLDVFMVWIALYVYLLSKFLFTFFICLFSVYVYFLLERVLFILVYIFLCGDFGSSLEIHNQVQCLQVTKVAFDCQVLIVLNLIIGDCLMVSSGQDVVHLVVTSCWG